jgi:hypothetical protein
MSMPKRVTLQLSDAALAVLADRTRVGYLQQGAWVSRAIVEAAQRQDQARIAALEAELARLRS